jgi:hypothetical protein
LLDVAERSGLEFDRIDRAASLLEEHALLATPSISNAEPAVPHANE